MANINTKELNKLFVEIKNNNIKAFEDLYNIYSKLVYSIAFSIAKNKQDAEDITQIVFTRIYSIEKSKLPIKNEASWLYSTTKNETINFLKKRNNNISLDEIYKVEDNNNEVNKIIDKDSYNKIISGLNEKEKEIISLKVLANLSFDEIGKILKTPTGTIKWRYYKSIHTLKILLSNLVMFIITAILSITTLKNQRNKNLSVEHEISKEDNENVVEEDISATPPKEELKKDESILENSNLQIQENTINNTNYVRLSFIGISTIFFLITIIFFIIFTKYQLKRRK